MGAVLHLSFGNDIPLASEVTRALKGEGIQVRKAPRTRSFTGMEVLVSLGSAGAFTALLGIISKVLEKNKDKEITVERGKKKITIKGYSLVGTRHILEMLAPEMLEKE